MGMVSCNGEGWGMGLPAEWNGADEGLKLGPRWLLCHYSFYWWDFGRGINTLPRSNTSTCSLDQLPVGPPF